MESSHQFGFVAIAGPPNAGKSTLLNQFVGQKVSIVSRKPQTTRHRILGVHTRPGCQMVFVDMPGLHTDQSRRLNKVLNRTAISSLSEVDLVVFMIDYRGWTEELRQVFAHAGSQRSPVVLVINKIDMLKDKSMLLPLIEESRKVHDFVEIIPISALDHENAASLLKVLAGYMPEGPPGFPEEQITDRSRRFLASELVREAMLSMLGQELPYASAVEVTRFEAGKNGMLLVDATIWVERPGQKPIVIGQGGTRLRQIGKAARVQMEELFGQRVYLDLWVKVKRGWADNAAHLQSLGYSEV